MEGLHRGNLSIEHHEVVLISVQIGDPYPGLRTVHIARLHDTAAGVANIEQRTLGTWFIVEHEQPLDLIDADADLALLSVHDDA